MHAVDSSFQKSKIPIHVLLPDDFFVEAGAPVVYALPLELHLHHDGGDGLAEVRRRDFHNGDHVIVVKPMFSHSSWYAEHPTNPSIRVSNGMREAHTTIALLPFAWSLQFRGGIWVQCSRARVFWLNSGSVRECAPGVLDCERRNHG